MVVLLVIKRKEDGIDDLIKTLDKFSTPMISDKE